MTRQAAHGTRRIAQGDAPPRIAYTVPEVAKALGIAQKSVRGLIHEQRLRAIRVGPRFVVPVTALDEFLADTA